jgi:adhesin/invasin
MGAAYLYGQASALSAVFGNNQGAPAGTIFGTLPGVQVIDALGNPVSGATVTFTESDGSGGAGGAFAGATTVITNAQGIAYAPPLTANDVAGSFTVIAANGTLFTTLTLTNLPGPAAQLAVADTPASVTAGVPFSFQVDVEDAFGNLVTGDHSLVAVALSGGPGGFTAGMTSAQAIDGVATFTGSEVQAASTSYVLGFRDGPLTGTTAGLTIVPAAPVAVTAASGTPQRANIGQPYATALAVVVQDSFGNPVSGVPVAFAAPDKGASGSFSGSTSVLTDANGIATAPILVANRVLGHFLVTATAQGIAPPVQFALTNIPRGQSTTLAAGLAAHVSIAAAPLTQQTSTSTLPVALVVTDRFGNPLENVAVTFTVRPNARTGAGGTFDGDAAVVVETDADGEAAPLLQLNGKPGRFRVTASVSGVAHKVVFRLTIR